MCGERGDVHGGDDGGAGAVAEVGVIYRDEPYFVFDHGRPSSIALVVMFQVGCTCTSYKPR